MRCSSEEESLSVNVQDTRDLCKKKARYIAIQIRGPCVKH
jgi:hypothetical protein